MKFPNPLRPIINMHRSWRLLKVVTAAQAKQPGTGREVEQFLENASREAFELHRHLSVIRRDQQKMKGVVSGRLNQSLHRQEEEIVWVEKKAMQVIQAMDKVTSLLSRVDSKFTETETVLQSLKDYTMDQQKEIRRLREGYDFTLLRNFAIRIIHALEESEAMIKKKRGKHDSKEHLDDLCFMRDNFRFALEGSGIEEFNPEVGAPFEQANRELEPAGTELATSQEQHLTIAEIVRPGFYHYLSEEKRQVIRPAQIKYFKFNPNPASLT